MSAIAQSPLIDAGPAVPATGRAPAAPRPRRTERKHASGGRQMRLRLVPRPADAPTTLLDPRALAHAAARLVARPELPLVELRLYGHRALPPAPGGAEARASDAPDALLLVAPCAVGGDGLGAFDGRAVVVGRGARSERLAGRARLEGPWLWLAPLAEDGPEARLPRADARVWGEVVTVVRGAGRGGAAQAGDLRLG